MNNLNNPLKALKKLREELHDSLDKSKRDELDNIIASLERDDITQAEKLEWFGQAVKLIPWIVKLLEIFR